VDPERRPSIKDMIKHPIINLRNNERKLRDQEAKLKHKEHHNDKLELRFKNAEEALEAREKQAKDKKSKMLELYNENLRRLKEVQKIQQRLLLKGHNIQQF